MKPSRIKTNKEIMAVKSISFNLHKGIEENLLNRITSYLISKRLDYTIRIEDEVAYMRVRFYEDSVSKIDDLINQVNKEMSYLKDFYSELYQVEDK